MGEAGRGDSKDGEYGNRERKEKQEEFGMHDDDVRDFGGLSMVVSNMKEAFHLWKQSTNWKVREV